MGSKYKCPFHPRNNYDGCKHCQANLERYNMTLTSRIETLAVGKSITPTRVRVETKPNGLIELFDFGSKLYLLVDKEGNRRGGSLPLTKAQIRELTGIQV